MKIVILDGYTLNPGDLSWNEFEKLGQCKVYERTSLTNTDEIIERIGDAQIVFTNKTPLPEKVFESCVDIKFVGVLATGYNVVDVNAARSRNIPVANIPMEQRQLGNLPLPCCWRFAIILVITARQYSQGNGIPVRTGVSGIIL